MPVIPRILNNVAYMTDIMHETHFAWQAQYLVTLVLRALQMRIL